MAGSPDDDGEAFPVVLSLANMPDVRCTLWMALSRDWLSEHIVMHSAGQLADAQPRARRREVLSSL